jgi:uncharacterized protein (DUF924 family)
MQLKTHPTLARMAMIYPHGWSSEVLKFWFTETASESWFTKDPAFDEAIRARFLNLHEALVCCEDQSLVSDARIALAAVLVLDQMSRNMFRDTPKAYAADPRALWIAQEAIARGYEAGLTKDERMFLYLPFTHCEDSRAQARCVELMATLNDPDLDKWAQAHQVVVDRFGRFPHRNRILGRTSTAEEAEFLKLPGSSF